MYLERATFVTGEQSAIADRRSWAVTRCRWSESTSCGSPCRRPAHQWTPMERSAARSVRAVQISEARRNASSWAGASRASRQRRTALTRLSNERRPGVSDPARPAMSAAGQPGT